MFVYLEYLLSLCVTTSHYVDYEREDYQDEGAFSVKKHHFMQQKVSDLHIYIIFVVLQFVDPMLMVGVTSSENIFIFLNEVGGEDEKLELTFVQYIEVPCKFYILKGTLKCVC